MARPVPDRVPPLRVKRRRRDATLHRRVAMRTVVGRASVAPASVAIAATPTAPASVAASTAVCLRRRCFHRGEQHLLAGP